ncbi:hypothetical protein [Longispora albida]|uniref:hypothetical protein n=1 Tax=Longispora albida TaxID=203523 RepID=UPI000371A691|nr:hypothetical protein [Longispora albida]
MSGNSLPAARSVAGRVLRQAGAAVMCPFRGALCTGAGVAALIWLIHPEMLTGLL